MQTIYKIETRFALAGTVTYYSTEQLLVLCWGYIINLNRLPLTQGGWKENDRKLSQFSFQDWPLRICFISWSLGWDMISGTIKPFPLQLAKQQFLSNIFHKWMLWRECCSEVLPCDLGQITSVGLSSSTRKIRAQDKVSQRPLGPKAVWLPNSKTSK